MKPLRWGRPKPPQVGCQIATARGHHTEAKQPDAENGQIAGLRHRADRYDEVSPRNILLEREPRRLVRG